MQTLLRHLLTAVGGALLIDTSNTQALIGGLVCIGFTWLWSLVSKLEWTAAIHLRDDFKDVAKKALAALISQGFAALSGWLMASGFDADPNDPVAVMLFLGNLGASKMGWTQKVMGLRPVLIAVLCSLFSVFGCSCGAFTKGDAVILGKRIGLATGDAAVAYARIELAKKIDAWVKAEESGDPIKIAMASLAMQAAQEALDAAERAIAKERAKLDAKQPVNVNPPISQIGVPVYAPQVVAMLQAR